MDSNIKDGIVPLLQKIQSDITVVKSGVSVLKEHTRKIDQRLGAVEAHMSGFMSTSKYFETEMDQLRGRVEALENPRPDIE